MFFTAKMKYLQILVLEKDFNKIVDLLGKFGWIEIKKTNESNENSRLSSVKGKIENNSQIIQDIEKMIYNITEFLDMEISHDKGELEELDKIHKYLSYLNEKIIPKKDIYKKLIDKRQELENGLTELYQFKDLKITKSELENLSFLYPIIGSLSKEDLDQLLISMEGRIIDINLNKDLYLLFTSKKGRWTLESELKKVNFIKKEIPFDDNILPNEVYLKVQDEIKTLNKEIKEIEEYRDKIKKSESVKINSMVENFNLQVIYHNLYHSTDHSQTTSLIEGWILEKNLKEIINKLDTLLKKNYSIITLNPEEIEKSKKEKLKIPVVLENPLILKPFEKLVYNYGAPSYGSIDPTVFVGISFFLFFGYMFGDIGQGFMILLAGLLLKFTNFNKFSKYKDIASLLIYAGISAVIFGYIYGAIFCYEHIKSVFSPINKIIFGRPVPYIINASFSSIDNVIFIVVLAIACGITVNLIGIILNIVNSFKYNKIEDAVLSRNGIAGFLLLLSLFVMYIQGFFFKKTPYLFLIYIVLGSLFIIYIKEPLYKVITKKKPIFNEGFGFWILHSIVELLEVVLITISNNLSFLRVGAFAITHALLSFIFIRISELFGYFGIIIVIIGNAIIIGLEGLIVSIQIMRLEYYEFFSKFFTQKGNIFMPFKVNRKDRILKNKI